MKVALVGPVYPYRGGIAHYTTMLARALAEKHETLVVSFRRQYPNWLYPGKSDRDPSREPLRVACGSSRSCPCAGLEDDGEVRVTPCIAPERRPFTGGVERLNWSAVPYSEGAAPGRQLINQKAGSEECPR